MPKITLIVISVKVTNTAFYSGVCKTTYFPVDRMLIFFHFNNVTINK